MRASLGILLVVIGLIACNRKIENDKVTKKGLLIKSNYYSDNTLKSKGNDNNGTRVGEWRFYNEKGLLVMLLNYKKTIPNVEYRWSLVSENGGGSIFAKNLLEGMAYEWDNEGLLRSQTLYGSNGAQSYSFIYGVSGELLRKVIFKNNVENPFPEKFYRKVKSDSIIFFKEFFETTGGIPVVNSIDTVIYYTPVDSFLLD